MEDSGFSGTFEKTSDFLNNALQLAVTTALRLAEDASGNGVQRRISDLPLNDLPEITLDQVSWHDHYDSCWIVLYDRVYDITEFLQEHPGGGDVLVEYAGRDATLAFRGFGHSAEAWKILQKYLIGVLPEEERTGIFKEEKLIERNTRPSMAFDPVKEKGIRERNLWQSVLDNLISEGVKMELFWLKMKSTKDWKGKITDVQWLPFQTMQKPLEAEHIYQGKSNFLPPRTKSKTRLNIELKFQSTEITAIKCF